MYCTACGNANQISGAFCARCGARQSETGADEKRESTPNERLRVMQTFSLGNSLMAATATILLYYFNLGHNPHWSIYAAAAICTVIAAHQAVSFYFNLKLRQRLKEAHERAQTANTLNAPSATAHALPPADTREIIKPAQSVTERTTQLLEPARRNKEL